MMVAAAVPAFHLQQLYYRHVGSIQHQSGPAKWVEDVTHVPVSKVAYTARSVLIAPPVIFQTRHQVHVLSSWMLCPGFLDAMS
eukprot:270886-Rhodomonas_salina.4